MVKKLFALASVTALTGLMSAVAASGCSSSSTDGGAAAGDAAVDSKGTTDAARKETSVDPPVEAAANCWASDVIAPAGLPFKTPTAPVAGACTEADLVAMEKAVDKNNQITLAALKTSVAAPCQACAFGEASAATWAPVVLNVTIAGKTGELSNIGGCMAYLSGSDECGKTYADWNDCLDTACRTTECEANQTSQTTCFGSKGAVNDACKAQTQSLVKVCGSTVDTNLGACQDAGKACTTCGGQSGAIKYVFEEAVVVQCLKAPVKTTDGGSGG